MITSLEAGKRASIDTVLINGDLSDFYQLSKFGKDPRMRRWVDEIKLTRDFMAFIRAYFPKAAILYKLGNHDERYEIYLQRNCAELIGLEDFELHNVLKLDDHGIDLVRDKRLVRLGNLNVIHGHEYSFAISNPVNAARGLFLRAKAYALCGHMHQKSEHGENNIEGSSISTWSTGCLCDLHPQWKPFNNWSHGFAIVESQSNGKFHVSNHKVSDGVIY